jgi:enhancing lycopene biosynthesis protein 2
MRVAVVLSGCGHLDGAEIRESVLTLLALEEEGMQYDIFAPDVDQHDVVNHFTGKEEQETRNVLVEAARIARGKISPMLELHARDYAAVIFPGGFGAAKSLSDVAENGGNAHAIKQVEHVVRDFWESKKPIGAICIAPAVIACGLRGLAVPTITLGEHNEMLEGLEAKEKVCKADEIAVDSLNLIISTPAYMTNEGIPQIAVGIRKLVKEVARMARDA